MDRQNRPEKVRVTQAGGSTCLYGCRGDRTAEILLEMRNITKTFPGVKVPDNINLKAEKREIHALVGENGAGRFTLMNVFSDIYPCGAYEDDIIYDSQVCRSDKINDSEEKGIVIIRQELALISCMSIGENTYLGNEEGKKMVINWDQTCDGAGRYLKIVGLSESSHTLIKDIGVGEQQLMEIAKALAKKARLLILDGPTAPLNEDDSKALLELLLRFKQEGITPITISHRLNEIVYVADRITVICDGPTIEALDRQTDDVSEGWVMKGMVGRELADQFPRRESISVDSIVLKVRDWAVYHPLYSDRKVMDHVLLHVNKEEMVGICGFMGTERMGLAMSTFGRSYGTGISGQLYIEGEKVYLNTVQDATCRRIACVTKDRKRNGLILSNPTCVDTTLANMGTTSSHGAINKGKGYTVAVEHKDKLRIKCLGVEQNAGNLDDDSQQEMLPAKWIFTGPGVLILDGPTRGTDVGAEYEMYCIIDRLVEKGKSVITMSSELPEVLGTSDHIYIMNGGRLAGEADASEASRGYIMSCTLKAGKRE